MRISISDVLLVDIQTAGRLVQPFEQQFRAVIVLDDRGLELRECERFGPYKYAIHRERMDALSVQALTPEREQLFAEAFRRSGKAEADPREAARLALKVLS